MCGFAGFLTPFDMGAGAPVSRLLEQMGNAIRHRGPDSDGTWFDRTSGVAFVHRRLAVVDLSAAGHQPMLSENGRHVLAFNGEIYNHLDLRRELEKGDHAPQWRGYSDTETLLAGFSAWGVEETLKRSTGMFAIALWDRETRSLTLGRDRFGEKPLYYGWQGKGECRTLLFGSELKALRVHPAFEGAVDRGALALQMRHNYVPAPYSIYEGLQKLAPGALLTISANGGAPEVRKYWDAVEEAERALQDPFAGSETDAVEELDRLLRDAVSQQMVADVPLGAFLSGGIDSSTVVALMQAQSGRPVRTFTIGFHEKGYNEAEHAKAAAAHLGTDHTELYVTPEQAMAVIPKLPALYDEPFSDSSQIPTYLISSLAREHVTVSLSGDAGDEIFGGYSRYQRTHRLWRGLSRVPGVLRGSLAKTVKSIPVAAWDGLATPVRPFLGHRLRNVGDKAHKLADMIGDREFLQFYRQFVTHWRHEDGVVVGGNEPTNYFSSPPQGGAADDRFGSMMLADTLTYLPDDILVKVDRAAMGVSLETRVPFLDHRIFEFAWKLPLTAKIRAGQGKWILRQVLYKYVPKELIDRPKMGFGVPIDAWLRGALREWAENLLDERRLKHEGFFNPQPIRKKWLEHVSGQRTWQFYLWDVLMFQAWLDGVSGEQVSRSVA